IPAVPLTFISIVYVTFLIRVFWHLGDWAGLPDPRMYAHGTHHRGGDWDGGFARRYGCALVHDGRSARLSGDGLAATADLFPDFSFRTGRNIDVRCSSSHGAARRQVLEHGSAAGWIGAAARIERGAGLDFIHAWLVDSVGTA